MAKIASDNEMFYTAFQPKLKNNYLMYIENVPTWMVKMVSRPQIEAEAIELPHMNIMQKVQGRATWGDISLSLYDPTSPSGAQVAMEWFRLHHESFSGRKGYADFYKKDITLVLVGPPGDYVEEWQLKGAFIKSINFNDLSFDASEPTTIDLTLSVDWCLLLY